MITKAILITAISASAIGGRSAALQPTAIELAAGPVRISASGETGIDAALDPAFDLRLSVTLRGDTRISIR